MKILHISSTDNGGAGLACIRLSKALSNIGIENYILVSQKFSNNSNVYIANPQSKIKNIKAKILNRINWKFIRNNNTFISSPITNYDITKHPLVQQADIIHLHWVGNFIDYPSFFKKINKPILWTFHDDSVLLGGYHYNSQKKEYKFFLENYYHKIKIKAIQNKKNINLLAISNEMQEKMLNCNYLKTKNIFKINNCIDFQTFDIKNKELLKQTFKIEQKIVFLFVSVYLSDQRKNLNLAIQALENLKIKDSILICVGKGYCPQSDKIKIKQYDSMPIEILPLFYSIADYFLFPSREETFAQTPLEAMSCGCPTILTPHSGAKEQIRDFNGTLAEDFSVESFTNAIRLALEKKYDQQQIRQFVIDNFSPEKIAKEYLEVYNNILKNK